MFTGASRTAVRVLLATGIGICVVLVALTLTAAHAMPAPAARIGVCAFAALTVLLCVRCVRQVRRDALPRLALVLVIPSVLVAVLTSEEVSVAGLETAARPDAQLQHAGLALLLWSWSLFPLVGLLELLEPPPRDGDGAGDALLPCARVIAATGKHDARATGRGPLRRRHCSAAPLPTGGEPGGR